MHTCVECVYHGGFHFKSWVLSCISPVYFQQCDNYGVLYCVSIRYIKGKDTYILEHKRMCIRTLFLKAFDIVPSVHLWRHMEKLATK